MCILCILSYSHQPSARCECEEVGRAWWREEEEEEEREGDKRYNFTPVRFMASEKTTGEGDGGEVRSLNNSFSSFVSVFKEHVQTILQAVFQCSSPSKNKTVFHHLFIYLCCVTLYFSVYIMFVMSTFKSPNILPYRHVALLFILSGVHSEDA